MPTPAEVSSLTIRCLAVVVIISVPTKCLAFSVKNVISDQVTRSRRQVAVPHYFSREVSFGQGPNKGPEFGPWGQWTESSECSRSCGGGVAYQDRICMSARSSNIFACVGPSRRYFSCNTQDCPTGSKDFREFQCGRFNSIPYQGRYHRWVPYYKASNPCELYCHSGGEAFPSRLAKKVIDGTRCYNDGSLDVCVNGICMPVGCDRVLGSTLRDDTCGECGGDGSSCRTVQGIMDRNDFENGYNDFLLIPAGATFIDIKDTQPTRNFLAIRNLAGRFYLNGDWQIGFSQDISVAGTIFHYERKPHGFPATERLRARGPTSESIFLVLLYHELNLGISYEYSVPVGANPATPDSYSWTFGDYEECSQTCGGGIQYRPVRCLRASDRDIVSDDLCDPSLKPATNTSCNSQPCPSRWEIGEWSNCSHPCGGGSQFRLVYCHQLKDGHASVFVPEEECPQPKPLFMRACNDDKECPRWVISEWSQCDETCGPGNQTRKVECRSSEDDSLVDDSQCSIRTKPSDAQKCSLGPCEGVEWIVSDWSGCEGMCSSSMESREVHCANEEGVVFPDAACDTSRIPDVTRSCPVTSVCEPMWHTSEWAECSAKCGSGVQTRVIFCGVWEKDTVIKIDDSKCDPEKKFTEVQNCSSSLCKGVWFTGPWSRCSAACGGGEKSRKILCFYEDEVVDLNRCEPAETPFEKETCNMHPCDPDEMIMMPGGCKDSKYGCCPDGITTSGENFQGCPLVKVTPDSTCEDAEFGCCPDGITLAPGPFKKGCLPAAGCNSTKYGCCSDNTTAAVGPDGEGCPTIADCFNSSFGCCPDDLTPAAGENYLGCETTPACLDSSRSDCFIDPLESSGEDCVGTEFGCCPDGMTPALGASKEGCPQDLTATTMNCIMTKFGCCEDNITTAKGPAFEGCDVEEGSGVSELTDCSLTFFGCCSDNVTAAEGMDGEGCSGMVDCSNSSHGCCPDNITSALGPDNEGCQKGTNGTCHDTEFGCCPDGIFAADGLNYENCSTDCNETTFGCCQDGYSFAKGLGYEGCESSNCTLSEFGCCEDNITIAQGWYGEGCESVSIIECQNSTYGCCPDNVTSATGADGEGCDEVLDTTCQNTTYGCCPDNATAATGENNEGCDEVSDTMCQNTTFGCCPDNATAAAGENGEGCDEVLDTMCQNTTFGCCPDNVTVADGENGEGCDISDCTNSTFGCCRDNITSASGLDYEGCNQTVVICHDSTFGCCPDNVTVASGLFYEGCNETDCAGSEFGCCSDNITEVLGSSGEGCVETITVESTTEMESTTEIASTVEMKSTTELITSTVLPVEENACVNTLFGCCPDGRTMARGPKLEGCCFGMNFGCCPDNVTAALGPSFLGCGCQTFPYGCCPDGITPAQGYKFYGCSCKHFQYGCCQDEHTPATGPNFDGCVCDRMRFGCCPDGRTPMTGPNDEGCEGCTASLYGCCPDGKTAAIRTDLYGCPCETLPFGCCPDGRTPATSSDIRDCPCNTHRHGCCPDETTTATGPEYQGCPCETLRFGCCLDGITQARGPGQQGCPCEITKYGCCVDGITTSLGPNYRGCPEVQKPEVKVGSEVCSRPKEPGPCRNYTVKWFFDVVYGGCMRFWFGGCEGNGNVFSTQEQCEAVCVTPERPEACSLPRVVGPCDGSYHSWYYDLGSQTCESFMYGGCLGNNNRFSTKDSCQESCIHHEEVDVCEQPLAFGDCLDQISRWYYNTHDRECKQFLYTGCGGNDNNFQSKQQCQQSCTEATNKEVCILPKAEGQCLGNFPRWYYDYMDKQCKEFTYTGCQGNKNRFTTLHQCESTCRTVHVQVPVDVCSLPEDAGPCDDSIHRWYYNSAAARCDPFYYGGCEGNANRFQARTECERACLPNTDRDGGVCRLPQEKGTCSDFRERWYFDYEASQCRRFYFSGCGGNENNFGSFFECEEQCSRTTAIESYDREFTIEFCALTVDPGPCAKAELRWYYDKTDGVCKEFNYGGCKGNRNKFHTRKECETLCGNSQDVCVLPVVKGPCSGSFTQWYYDSTQDECLEFLFSGCQGNANRFNSQENCHKQCKKRISPTDPSVSISDICLLPQEPGPCLGYYLMWYYDSSDNTCKSFAFGGCDGNENQFEKRTECEDRCVKKGKGMKFKPKDSTTVTADSYGDNNEDVCRLPVEPGPCSESHSRWFYDPQSLICRQFTYGGCEGNKNRFKTKDICFRFCSGVKATPYFIESSLTTTTSTTTTTTETICPESNCAEIQCPFGIEEKTDVLGCSTCKCSNPCEAHHCPSGKRCAIQVSRLPQGSTRTEPVCREIQKAGECPAPEENPLIEANELRRRMCEDRCRDDADCRSSQKCCFNGCAFLCLEPTKLEESTEDPNQVVPASILPGDDVFVGIVGEPVILLCQAIGVPKPSVTWWRDATMLPITSRRYEQRSDHSLIVRSVAYEDRGDYLCRAHNGIGSGATLRVTLSVQVAHNVAVFPNGHTHFGMPKNFPENEYEIRSSEPEIPDENEQPEHNVPLVAQVTLVTPETSVGSWIQIDCETGGPPPGPHVTWEFQGEEIQRSSRKNILVNNTLIISKAESQDSGDYTCIARHANSVASSSVMIKIKDVSLPADCIDSPQFANCEIIVNAKYCNNKYYGKYCCESCMKAGQLLRWPLD